MRASPRRARAAPRRRHGLRLAAVFVVLAAVLAAVVVRLVDLQVLSSDRYARLGLGQRVSAVELPAERGAIFDRTGADLAVSLPAQTIYADPRVITDPGGAALELSPVLGIPAAALLPKLADQDRAFVYLLRQADDATADAVEELGIPGVAMYPESKRHYPGGDLAGALLGVTGIDHNGLEGLEYAYDDVLTGRPGRLEVERDPQGREIPNGDRSYRPPEPGADLVLTLDQSIQYEAERLLVDAVGAASADGGVAVVMDVTTGDVLAMATVNGDGGALRARPEPIGGRNRPVTDVFEPGSTAKLVTIAAALEAGVVAPDTVFEVPYSIVVDNKTFKDDHWHPVESWTVTDIIRESSNIGTILIARELGQDRFDAALRAFGFGSVSALQMPGEAAGILLDVADYSDTSMVTMPIGHGIAVTAVQMLDAFVTIANGGISRPPRLVGATVDERGARHEVPAAPGERVVSEATAAATAQMLQAVVTDGTGKRAAVAGYPVAGKTGTSIKPPYEQKRHWASFAGFAPADAPRLAVVVMLDEPQSSVYGGTVAAPVFSDLMQFSLRRLGVPARSTVEFPPPPDESVVPPPDPTGDDAATASGGRVTTSTSSTG